jgi:hypothetical protein
MITISCTKKLFELSGFMEEQDTDTETSNEFLKWHANVFRMARKNNIILMNNRTRYCFILFGVKKEHFKNFKEIFIQAFTENLRSEQISESKIKKYVSEIDRIKFAKTYDRSVLGSMTDMVKMTEFLIEDYLPIQEMNIIDLNKKNNHSPIVKLKSYPDVLMKDALS